MGFLESLFGGKKYPPLKDGTQVAYELEAVKTPLEDLTKEINETMEVVPAVDGAYVFIGNPYKNFGMAWIEQGKVHNFKTLTDEKGLAQPQLIKMLNKLQDAYHRSGDDKRFSTMIGGKNVTVTPSRELAREVKDIIANA